jgi:uncharacterized damage-inducible protein DinB
LDGVIECIQMALLIGLSYLVRNSNTLLASSARYDLGAMTSKELNRIVESNNWGWEKWWPELLKLSKEQAHQEVGGSFPSVFATTEHLVWAELLWQRRIEGGNTSKVFPKKPASLKALHRHWLELVPHRKAYFETASPKENITYTMLDGTTTFTNTLQDIMVHVTSHAHFHRGQLASQFRMLGLKPPSAHLIGYFRLG